MSDEKTWWNGQVKKTWLGSDDHGGFTFWINVEGNGQGQSIGNYCLYGAGKYEPWAIEAIAEILRVVKVDSWEQLPGKFVRVQSTHDKVYCIMNITDTTRWFDIVEFVRCKSWNVM
jgi:hypothetical protein